MAYKQQAAEIFESLGLNLPIAINIFMLRIYFYSEINQTELHRFKKLAKVNVHEHQPLDDDEQMVVKFLADTWDEYVEWQSEDRKTLKRINQLIKSIIKFRNYTELEMNRCPIAPPADIINMNLVTLDNHLKSI